MWNENLPRYGKYAFFPYVIAVVYGCDWFIMQFL